MQAIRESPKESEAVGHDVGGPLPHIILLEPGASLTLTPDRFTLLSSSLIPVNNWKPTDNDRQLNAGLTTIIDDTKSLSQVRSSLVESVKT